MYKKFLPLLGLMLCILPACSQQGSGPITAEQAQNMPAIHDVDTDVCKQFDIDFVYTVLQLPIVKIQPSDVKGVFGCTYYTEYSDTFFKDDKTGKTYSGGRMISLVIGDININRQKGNMETLGLTVSSDTTIGMTNLIGKRSDGSIWAIYLFTNPNRFLSINLLQKPNITDKVLIDFAARVADSIQGKTIPLQKNPGISDENSTEVIVPPLRQEDVVRNFFNLISEGKLADAANMMDADENTKQAWAVNFNTLQSLAVTSMEPVYQDEWTNTRQVYEVTLNITLKSVPNTYGWNNGRNVRWITLEKTSSTWMIHELANNP